jgi:LacI family transcriptional regulator
VFAEAAAVPLTSVAQPRQLIGRTAAEMVIAEARERGGAHEHRQVVLTPELVVRASSRLRPLNGVA